MKKIKMMRKQLKTVAKYLYRPEFHGSWTDLLIALEETFDVQENTLPKRRPHQIKRRELPPPIPLEALPKKERVEEERSRNYGKYRVTVHRGTPRTRTLCGSVGWDVVTTEEDSLVTCKNCQLPKYQAKLREEKAEKENDNVGRDYPRKQLPITPHFLTSSSNSSEM